MFINMYYFISCNLFACSYLLCAPWQFAILLLVGHIIVTFASSMGYAISSTDSDIGITQLYLAMTRMLLFSAILAWNEKLLLVLFPNTDFLFFVRTEEEGVIGNEERANAERIRVVLSCIPPVQYNSINVPLNESNCGICFEDYKSDDNISSICKIHYYHDSCLQEWCRRVNAGQSKHGCPLCNYKNKK